MNSTTQVVFGAVSREVAIRDAEGLPAARGIILGLGLSCLLWMPVLATFLHH
ncbi:MAG TPA: hypothetical protein VGM87_02400 [Roseomonas sp.]